MRILYGKSTQCTFEILNYNIVAFYFANFLTRHFNLFSERLREINKAFLFKTQPSEASRAISLLRKRNLEMYRQNKKEEQISLFLIC